MIDQAGPVSGKFEPGLVPRISELVSGRIRHGVLGSTLTTFAIGGPLAALITVESPEELGAVLQALAAEGQPVRALGFGSNCLIDDCGLDQWVVRLGAGFKGLTIRDDGRVMVGAAASLMSVARKLSDEGFSGLEFAAGIPASLGGAVFMNAGAHGSELCDRIVSVQGVLPTGASATWARSELPWRYRSSGFPVGAVVTSVTVQLEPGDKAKISRICSDNLAERRARQPLALSSAGSVFKNPSPEAPAGRLLETAGLKGVRVGGAIVSELHANWIVNPERKATAADVMMLMGLCQQRVRASCGIELEPEVRLWRS
jgi:UDP-N-acetylmuramate dehydrogenase